MGKMKPIKIIKSCCEIKLKEGLGGGGKDAKPQLKEN